MERPAPYSFSPRFEWQHCEVEGLEGFAILVRPTITNREREVLVAQHGKIVEYELEWVKLGPERDQEDTPRKREMTLLAPYIKEWNAVGLLEDGTEAPLPSPAEAGPDAFLAIDAAAYDWIVQHLLLGYRASGKAGSWDGKSRRTRGTSPAGNGGDQS